MEVPQKKKKKNIAEDIFEENVKIKSLGLKTMDEWS